MAKSKFCLFLYSGLFLCVLLAPSRTANAQGTIAPEELVAKHVKSIGDPGVLAAVQNRLSIGSSTVRFIQGATGSMVGTSMVVSEGNKLVITTKFGDKDYPGEYFAYDGKEVTVGHVNPGQKSPIADFIFRNGRIIRDGLLGGTLSMNWPLLNIKERQPILKCRTAKVDGKELYELDYQPKDPLGNMKIKMYFEMDTFHHVRTEYRLRVTDDVSVRDDAPGAVSESASYETARRSIKDDVPESIYLLVEKFSDYKKVSGMILPQGYSIEYSLEGTGHAFVAHWDLTAKQWGINRTWPAEFFKAQK